MKDCKLMVPWCQSSYTLYYEREQRECPDLGDVAEEGRGDSADEQLHALGHFHLGVHPIGCRHLALISSPWCLHHPCEPTTLKLSERAHFLKQLQLLIQKMQSGCLQGC